MRERLEDLRLEPPKGDSLVRRTLRTTLRLHCLHRCDISQVYSRGLQGQTWPPLVGMASGHRGDRTLIPLRALEVFGAQRRRQVFNAVSSGWRIRVERRMYATTVRNGAQPAPTFS